MAWAALLLTPMTAIQLKALKPQDEVRFERAGGALALELGVRDASRIGRIFPNADWVLSLAETPRERHWSIFGLPPFRDAGRSIGGPAAAPARTCPGGVVDVHAIDGEPRFLRVSGWVDNAVSGANAAPLQIVDADGTVRGVALAGDCAPPDVDAAGRTGFVGYVRAEADSSSSPCSNPARRRRACGSSTREWATRMFDDRGRTARVAWRARRAPGRVTIESLPCEHRPGPAA